MLMPAMNAVEIPDRHHRPSGKLPKAIKSVEKIHCSPVIREMRGMTRARLPLSAAGALTGGIRGLENSAGGGTGGTEATQPACIAAALPPLPARLASLAFRGPAGDWCRRRAMDSFLARIEHATLPAGVVVCRRLCCMHLL